MRPNFEKARRGIQRRDFAVRAGKRGGGGDEDGRDNLPEEAEDSSPPAKIAQEEEKEEEKRALEGALEDEEEKPKEEELGKRAGSMIVEGYATTFNSPYQLMREGGYALFEKMDENAFDGCDMRDVIFQYDHAGRVYARTGNGTLELKADSRGLKVRADLSGTAEGRKLYEEIKGGYTTKMSFGFDIEDSEMEELPEEEILGFRTGSPDRYCLHTVRKIRRVYDVSAVSLPANEGTGIEARSRSLPRGLRDGIEERRRRLAFEIEMSLAERGY